MWTLALGLLKQFWKPLAIGVGVLMLILAVRHVWNQRYQNGYDDGVSDTQKAAAEYIAKRVIDLEKRERALEVHFAAEQAKLEGRLNETELIADSLRAQLRARRVCSDDTVRQEPVSTNPATATGSDGTARDQGPAQTVGDRVVEIVSEGQRCADKLITLQGWALKVMEASDAEHAR